ncbi:hypothetical protein BN13_1240021 [Nostocoides jenkinsii Ben 74]|uniref:Uncharacterized protein n=1 Tax=Nostocoides jenkinsii Ben 74 TaxID=1193518 RepID=A0A077M3L8_9MICO|nr:hypothetical protein BN13_1240021 [Tetrasphaera jenkinsii Ben 74]
MPPRIVRCAGEGWTPCRQRIEAGALIATAAGTSHRASVPAGTVLSGAAEAGVRTVLAVAMGGGRQGISRDRHGVMTVPAGTGVMTDPPRRVVRVDPSVTGATTGGETTGGATAHTLTGGMSGRATTEPMTAHTGIGATTGVDGTGGRTSPVATALPEAVRVAGRPVRG